MRFRTFAASSGLLAILLILGSTPSFGQEHASDPESSPGDHPAAEHEFHPNHFGGLVGVSLHSNTDDSAFTLGLEYARRFSLRWSVAVYLETISSSSERDIVVAGGVAFYLIRGLAVVVAPGIEGVERETVVHGEVETEKELGFLMRVGAAYAFQVTPQAGVGPLVFVDWAADRWTTVLGVAMVVGF